MSGSSKASWSQKPHFVFNHGRLEPGSCTQTHTHANTHTITDTDTHTHRWHFIPQYIHTARRRRQAHVATPRSHTSLRFQPSLTGVNRCRIIALTPPSLHLPLLRHTLHPSIHPSIHPSTLSSFPVHHPSTAVSRLTRSSLLPPPPLLSFVHPPSIQPRYPHATSH